MSANGARAAGTEPLLCALSWHDATPLALWNDGYYFSRCSRCGQDLIRTAFGRWTVPRGFRVVWSAQPPEMSKPARLPSKEAGARRTPVEFPIAKPASVVAETEVDTSKGTEDASVAASRPEAIKLATTGPDLRDEPPIFLDLRRRGGSTRPHEASRPVGPALPNQRRVAAAEELPIQQVLRTLRDDAAHAPTPAANETMALFPDGEDDEPYVLRGSSDAPLADAVSYEARVRGEPSSDPEDESGATVPPAPHPEAARLIIPDFMNEAPAEVPYDLRTGRIMSPEELRLAKAAASRPEPRTGGMRERLRDAGTSARAYMRPRRARSPMDKGAGDRLREMLERHAGLVAVTVFGAFVLAAALVEGLIERPARISAGMTADATPASPASQVPPSAPSTDAPAAETAFVTASLLNCRAAPAENGEIVRRLTRGAPVRLLSADAGWASVAHHGRQCWMSARFLSTAEPL